MNSKKNYLSFYEKLNLITTISEPTIAYKANDVLKLDDD